MKEFLQQLLNKLYSYENFGTYLSVAIGVLIVLFIIILFAGKKDQKNREFEATKKLEQVGLEAFKQENEYKSIEIDKNIPAPVVAPTEAPKLDDTVVLPSIDEINSVEEEIPEPVLPVSTPEVESEPINEFPEVDINEPVIEQPVLEPSVEIPKFEDTNYFSSPLPDYNDKPFVFEEEHDDFNFEEEHFDPISVMPVPEVKNEGVSIPSFDYDEIMKDTQVKEETVNKVEEQPVIEEKRVEPITRAQQVFSSVYAPEKITVDDEEFELPTLKKEVIEEAKEEVNNIAKEEVKMQVPDFSSFNFDDLTGETYNLK